MRKIEGTKENPLKERIESFLKSNWRGIASAGLNSESMDGITDGLLKDIESVIEERVRESASPTVIDYNALNQMVAKMEAKLYQRVADAEHRIASLEKSQKAIDDSLEMLAISQKKTLTFDEVVAYTGMSRSWLYKMTATKQIPHYKAGGKLNFFDKEELDQWLKQTRVSTTDEIQAQAQAYCMKNGRTR